MKKKSLSLLLNAESFGFGPSSAIGEFFPQLRAKVKTLNYIGDGHTLQLQRKLPYNQIYDLTEKRGMESSDEKFLEIVSHYDGFLTALDFHKAKLAIKAKIPTVIYDPLTWFWRLVPEVLREDNTLYLAQNFHNVENILNNKPHLFKNAKTVPPLAFKLDQSKERSIIMVNLGGLMNPFWKFETCILYAKVMIEAIQEIFDPKWGPIIYLGNKDLQKELPHLPLQSLSRNEMNQLLPQVKFSIQTSGLGNIYEGAAYNIPTLFLPPPGDSHGQQLFHLRAHEEVDEYLEWQDISPQLSIDYFLEQKKVMDRIAEAIETISKNSQLKSILKEQLNYKISRIFFSQKSNLSKLLDRFGENGAHIVAEKALTFFQLFQKESLC